MNSLVRSNSLSAAAVSLALSLFAIGCGDDSDDDGAGPSTGILDSGIDSGTGNGSDGGDAGTQPTTPAEAPVYAFATVPSVSAGAPTTSYIILSDKLTGELRIQGAALEIPGSAVVSGPVAGKRLFVGTQQSPVLTRYDLNDNGTLAKKNEVNFQARGVAGFTAYGSNFQYVDANKAYYLALNAGKIVVWNPETMALTGELAVPEVVRPDPANAGTNFTSSVTGAPIRVGDKLYWFVAWDSRTAGIIKIAPAAAVVVLDVKTDTAKVVVDEATCGYTRDGVVSGDYIYLASENAGASVYHLNSANAAPPCMRRFNTKTEQFDPDYKPDLTAIAGAPAGSLFLAPNGAPFMFVLDKALVDPKVTNPRELASGMWWKQARLTVGDNPKVELLNLPAASGSVLPQTLKDSLRVTPAFGAAPQMREVTNDGIVATSRVDAKLFGITQSYVQLR